MKRLDYYNLKFRVIVRRFSGLIEFAVAAVILIAVLISSYEVFVAIKNMVTSVLEGKGAMQGFDTLFALAIQLIIAVEFIIMLVNKSTESIVEVLTLVIAKKILVSHGTSQFELFFGVISVLLLIAARIAIRRFEDSQKSPYVLSSGTLVENANILTGSSLPEDLANTLGGLIYIKLKERNVPPKKGVSIYFDDVILRVHSMRDLNIDKVEVLPFANESHHD